MVTLNATFRAADRLTICTYQTMTSVFVKNMVCQRCVAAVRQEFEKVGLHPTQVALGEVTLESELEESTLVKLKSNLTALGFELIDDKKGRLIEAIKNRVIQKIHHTERLDLRFNWSDILKDELNHDYNYLSNLFSSVEGVTLEHYIIHQKIERVKELLFYDELTLSEIADRLGYSSVAHLSGQFKKITGLTPSELKKSRITSARKPLDSVG
jgi:YesN/AraC family two-component response regulator